MDSKSDDSGDIGTGIQLHELESERTSSRSSLCNECNESF